MQDFLSVPRIPSTLAHDKSLHAVSQDLVKPLTISYTNGDLSAAKLRLPEDTGLQPFPPLFGAAARYDESSTV